MATPEPGPEPAAAGFADFPAKIIWFSLLITHFMYVGLISFIHPPAQPATMLVTPLTAVAIMTGSAALVVYGILLSEPQIEKWITARKADGVTGQQLVSDVMGRAQAMSIVSWALAESVTIMGLVLSFTGQLPFNRFLLFVTAGVVIHLYCRPKSAEVRELLSRST